MDAPKHCNILVKTRVKWKQGHEQEVFGYKWVEAYWDGECWRPWEGSSRIHSTETLDPVAWSILPQDIHNA